MISIESIAHTSSETLRAVMECAFSDYAVPLRLDSASFAFMMQQRGLDVASSRIAVSDNDVVGIWLTAVRGKQAYLISSGTKPEYRGKGIARALANECLAHLRANGVASFQTEVLRSNTTAAGLYRSLGMVVSRDLSCFVVHPKKDAGTKVRTEVVAWAEISRSVPALRDWEPSWQNDDASITAVAEHVVCIAARDASGLNGFVALNSQSGTVFQIAVRARSRRQGVGSALLRAAARQTSDGRLRLINVPADDAGFHAFMTAQMAEQTEGQFELKMPSLQEPKQNSD